MTTASLPALAPNRELLALLGRTPLARITTGLPLPHPGFWAKLEGQAVGGMKARAAVSMLLGAEERGELLPGAPVVESTSGTLGIGLAFAGQALGHPVVLVGDSELEPSMRQLLRSYGARLELVDRPAAHGGWQGARLERLHDLLARLPGAYWPDQYNNPDNTAGYASSPPNWPPSSTTSTSSSAASAPGDTAPGSPDHCAGTGPPCASSPSTPPGPPSSDSPPRPA